MKFEGTADYVATPDLSVAVNAAIALERPLLVKGEPGTGKTELARQVAASLGLPLMEWHVKSTTRAVQGLYEYDAVSRLRDSQLGDARVQDVANYIRRGPLWRAFEAPGKVVLLIDEVDKADIEFPNDLLQELDRMEFFVYESGETVKARQRPVVIITSNNEKELPDAFLRRCFFHYIRFPDPETLARIVDVHFPGIKASLVRVALTSSSRSARPGPEEEALHLGGPRLAETAAQRGSGARGSAPGRIERPAPPPRRASEERAGRASLRSAGLHRPWPAVVTRNCHLADDNPAVPLYVAAQHKRELDNVQTAWRTNFSGFWIECGNGMAALRRVPGSDEHGGGRSHHATQHEDFARTHERAGSRRHVLREDHGLFQGHGERRHRRHARRPSGPDRQRGASAHQRQDAIQRAQIPFLTDTGRRPATPARIAP